MTITNQAQVVAEALLELVDELVTHRVNVITDSEWFTDVVRAEVQGFILNANLAVTLTEAEGVEA